MQFPRTLATIDNPNNNIELVFPSYEANKEHLGHILVTGCLLINLMFFFFETVCQCAVHKRCHDKILGKCPGSGKESQNTIVSMSIFSKHHL